MNRECSEIYADPYNLLLHCLLTLCGGRTAPYPRTDNFYGTQHPIGQRSKFPYIGIHRPNPIIMIQNNRNAISHSCSTN